MVETRMATRGTSELQRLTQQDIKDKLCPTATDVEAEIFLRYCQSLGLNPFAQEAYLIKYSRNDPAAIVLGLAGVLKRADALSLIHI